MQADLKCERNLTFLLPELRKLSSAALEILVGYTWGFQEVAFRILDERGLLLKVDETPLHTNKDSSQGVVLSMYVVDSKMGKPYPEQ